MRPTLTGLLLLISLTTWSQDNVYLSGFVNDINGLKPLPYVNISSKGRVLASTDQNGFFTATATRNDTIVFTRLGYQPYTVVAVEDNWDERIFMNEMSKMLDEVIIYDRYTIHGQDEMQKSLNQGAVVHKFDNFTMSPENSGRMVQTFGPSVTLGAPWNKWTKDYKEKKQLQAVLNEKQRTAVYNDFINSVVVEAYFMEAFTMDHDTFMKHKEGFIINHPDARYLRSRQDIIDLMVAYFASRKP